MQNNDYEIYERYTVNRFNYPNIFHPDTRPSIIENEDLKEGQPQINAYNLILEKIKDQDYAKEDIFEMLSLDFIKHSKPLKKGHNIVSINIKVNGNEFQFQVDFHINLSVASNVNSKAS